MPAGPWFLALIGVARGDLAGDMGALFEIALDDDAGRRRAAAIALLKAAIAAVEARHHLIVTVARGRFGLDQRLRFVAPFRALVAAANAAQEMQRAEDFRQPLQIVVVRRGHYLRRHRRRRLRRTRGLGPAVWADTVEDTVDRAAAAAAGRTGKIARRPARRSGTLQTAAWSKFGAS